MRHALTVRFRVDFGSRCSVGIGKIQLLEGIARTGSLSQAARQMRMSYRRAWLLLSDLNLSFDQPVARTSTGGSGGGGAVLTPFGERLIASYRKLESTLQPLADRCLDAVGVQVADRRPKQTLRSASIRRKQGRTEPGAAARNRNRLPNARSN
jgi:molybdate transport system regulatory protein